MTSSDRRSSFSPSEQQRAKSRSSSQSYRSPPNIIISEEDATREKTPSQTSKPSAQEINPTKRSDSSTSNRSTIVTSPTSNISKRQRSSLKSSSPPITNRRRLSKRKKSSISIAEIERRQLLEPNNEEKQDLTGHGFAMIPPEILDRKITNSSILLNTVCVYRFLVLTLRRLDISYNNISSLPPEIGLLINLEYLDISHNPLIVQNGRDDYLCFPREFRKLKNLRTLNLTECSLKHIPVVIWSIVSLQILDLSRNRIGFIVSEIGEHIFK
jgi:Leucine-rich repeat (LRR) protein